MLQFVATILLQIIIIIFQEASSKRTRAGKSFAQTAFSSRRANNMAELLGAQLLRRQSLARGHKKCYPADK